MAEVFWPIFLGSLAAIALTVFTVQAVLSYCRGSVTAARLMSHLTLPARGLCTLITALIVLVIVSFTATRWIEENVTILWPVFLGVLAANVLTAIASYAVLARQSGSIFWSAATKLGLGIPALGLIAISLIVNFVVLMGFANRAWLFIKTAFD